MSKTIPEGWAAQRKRRWRNPALQSRSGPTVTGVVGKYPDGERYYAIIGRKGKRLGGERGLTSHLEAAKACEKAALLTDNP